MPTKKSAATSARAAKKKNPQPRIEVRGARQNNLKGIDLDIPLGKLNVITGASGSGKSSLAFQTLYAEGQRRYVETFSPYTRQFFERMDKPKVDAIHGIPPAIAISQSNAVKTTRSTVGTITEINDYLKLLFPRLAIGYCPETGQEIRPDTPATVIARLADLGEKQAQIITFPVPVPSGTDPAEFLSFLQAEGYLRIVLFGVLYRTDLPPVTAGEENAVSSAAAATAASQGALDRPLPAVVDVVQDRVAPAKKSRMLEALEAAFQMGKGHLKCFHAETFDSYAFSTGWHCPDSGVTLKPPVPSLFSFNNAQGACSSCRGFGRVIGIDLKRALPDRSLSIEGGVVRAFQGERGAECQEDLERCCRARGVDLDCPFMDLPEDEQEWVLYGESGDPDENWQKGEWYGVQGFFDWLESKAYRMHIRVFLSRYRSYTDCPVCRGNRLNPDALNFKIQGQRLPDLWKLPVAELLPFVTGLEAPEGDRTCELIIREICSRLSYLEKVGLDYLNLDRATRSLSGGELQRVNLTTCLGAALTGTLFVLDEPSIGLHPQDTGRLIEVMEGLRDLGNTLVVVEHEEAIVRVADHVIEIGPGRGESGGELVHSGSLEELIACGGSLTADYLSGRKTIPVPARRRKPSSWLQIEGASANNLQNISVGIPLGVLTCVTGVSGSGKSTLVHDVLYRNLLKSRGQGGEEEVGLVRKLTGVGGVGEAVLVDQSPLVRTPRSTPAVFTGSYDHIRKLFAATSQAKMAGFTASTFSFNSGDGRCQRCMGTGFEKVEMQFLSDVFVTCPECEGTRFSPEVLEVELFGYHVHDLLTMTVDQAISFFDEIGSRPAQAAARPLRPLSEVGLGYLMLGQPLSTLSGGESQRLKLVSHLSGRGGKHQRSQAPLLIFDEPTTGLHADDIRVLLAAFQRLVDEGASVVVIEHNLDVIAHADHVIDLGPGAGSGGGNVVAEGTPEAVAAVDTPTGRHLRTKLAGSDARMRGKPIYDKPRSRSGSRVAESRPEALHSEAAITIDGAREHNLKNISLTIPHGRFVVVTGLSGSGKSTLAFDLIFAEGQRRFLDSMSTYARQFVEQMERPEVDRIAGLPPTVAIEQRISRGGGKSTVGTVTEVYHFLRLLYAKVGVQHSPDSGKPAIKQSATAIATRVREIARGGRTRILAPLVRGRKGYHTDVAAWAFKQGYEQLVVDRQIIDTVNFKRLDRFREHTIDALVAEIGPGTSSAELRKMIESALTVGKGTARIIDPENRFQTLSIHLSCPETGKSFEELEPRLFSFNSPHGWCRACRGYGKVPQSRYQELDTSRADSVLDAELQEERSRTRDSKANAYEICPGCQGDRLNETARFVRVHALSLPELVRVPAHEARRVIGRFKFKKREAQIARDILGEIDQRLAFLERVGLGYLSLDRSADTLSGGESQRIRLASQLGSNLQGVLYVLDEPTIGLHPRDNVRLLDTLVDLRNKGNSLLVVEHDEETMRRCDRMIDLGPGAGQFGGEVVAEGTLAQIKRNKQSVTGQALRRLKLFPHPWQGQRRPLPKDQSRKGWLRIKGCHANNLKNVAVQIPRGRLTVITGISGSGKSSLMRHCLFPALKQVLGKRKKPASGRTTPTKARRKISQPAGDTVKTYSTLSGAESLAAVYEVDQSPIGKTSRSTPGTYIKVFDEIRKLYAGVPEARIRGYTASRFSFNTEGGRCETCKGNGQIKLEMTFLPTSYVPCEDCLGKRYNDATLEILYKERSIADVMDMTVAEAAEFFESVKKIHRPLRLLTETGTGYLRLGQPSPTVSGGEAQRIKLVAELSKGIARSENARLKSNARPSLNVYLIEEPTIGLHMADIQKLAEVLHRLVDEGHTVVVIEHNIDLMQEADYLIDVGPEAGLEGGTVVACGTPEQVAESKVSRTAPFLQ